MCPLAEFTDKDEALDYCQGSIYIVLEYVEHDLTGLIDRQYPYVLSPRALSIQCARTTDSYTLIHISRFSDIEIKSIMQQLLEVMRHMHSLDIIHRYAQPHLPVAATIGATV